LIIERVFLWHSKKFSKKSPVRRGNGASLRLRRDTGIETQP